MEQPLPSIHFISRPAQISPVANTVVLRFEIFISMYEEMLEEGGGCKDALN